ncbi:MAG TPA: DNA repair protein RecO [Acidimicrobiaceae bacterium]|nr:DNA repair protein RecO [Acidimicrobiaceae bacterium]HAX05345.1 DNA repair protein RecO [Acidimicrobiaceae bacterium]
MAHYRDSGVIVRTHKLGEADRILSIITENHGKVRAVAKGVRKTRSRYGGRLELLRHLDLQFYQGRGDLDIVTQAETRDHWPEIQDDLDRLGKALTIAEAVDQVVQDKQENREVYRMLCGALETLRKSDPVLIVPAFMLKLLAHEGVAPAMDECVIGGEVTNLEFFDPRIGGVTCAAHQRGRRISSSALELMRATLGGALATVLEVQQAPHTDEVSALTHRLWEFHIERRLRSTELLS